MEIVSSRPFGPVPLSVVLRLSSFAGPREEDGGRAAGGRRGLKDLGELTRREGVVCNPSEILLRKGQRLGEIKR